MTEPTTLQIQILKGDTLQREVECQGYLLIGFTEGEVNFYTNVPDKPLLTYHLDKVKAQMLNAGADKLDVRSTFDEHSSDLQLLKSAVAVLQKKLEEIAPTVS